MARTPCTNTKPLTPPNNRHNPRTGSVPKSAQAFLSELVTNFDTRMVANFQFGEKQQD